ncbi:MAG: chemotaxis protein CheD [Deltaproteobacteria bacterium]|nr:MAG: chemotaxis protein CheD [Deltaproteobacteria bacterium]
MKKISVVHVGQGEFMTGEGEDLVLTTVLGSCVSVCLFDPERKVGGMNHFLVPESRSGSLRESRSGVHAMELLINAIMKAGARREHLCAKIFGGSRMIDGGTDIGAMNSRFALQFIKNEGIRCAGVDVGGTLGRKIRFWPGTGKAQRKFLEDFVSTEAALLRTRQTTARPFPEVEFF